jgi:bifunctional polynucleotide phosphatase/kinase
LSELTLARDLATNVGITFWTPEEYFLKEDPHPFERDFDPATFVRDAAQTSVDAGMHSECL